VRNRLGFILALLIGALLATIALGVALTSLERQHLVYTRFVRVDDLASVAPSYPENATAKEFSRRFAGDDPVEIMAKVRDAVTCVADDPGTEDPTALLEYADNGGGLVCTGLASIYRAALEANGFDARIVVLSRFLTDPYDTHTTVEVREGDRWVIYDPTFGVTFERAGQKLGAQDIKRALIEGGIEGIEPQAQDDGSSYPAQLDAYYMDWTSLFSNVVVREPAPSSWTKLPIVRWWLGEQRYYEVTRGHQGRNTVFLDALYWTAAVVLPIISLALLIACAVIGMYLLLSARRPRQPTDA